MSLGEAFLGVLVVLCLMAAGFFLGKLKILPESQEGPISTLCIKVAIPCTLFESCLRYIKRETLQEMGPVLLLPLVSILAIWGISMLVARIFKIPKEKRGAFCMLFSLSNSIFIGLPLCRAFFGEAALPYVTVFFPSNTVIFWTIGIAALSADGGKPYTFHPRTLAKVFSPPLVGSILGAVVALAEWPVPDFLLSSVTHVGNMTAPLSMLLTGSILSRMGKSALKLDRRGWLVLAGRFLLCPVLMLGLCLLARQLGWLSMGDGGLILSVFTLEAAMPVMNQSLIMARTLGADHKWVAQMLAISCVAALGILPLWVYLVSNLPG